MIAVVITCENARSHALAPNESFTSTLPLANNDVISHAMSSLSLDVKLSSLDCHLANAHLLF